MIKVLAYLEPVTFRNNPRFLEPHLSWIDLITRALRLGEGDQLVMMGSAALLRSAAQRLSTSEYTPISIEVDAVELLKKFQGDRWSYAQDLYAAPTSDAKQTALEDLTKSVLAEYKPDLVICTSENRYVRRSVDLICREACCVFIEKIPLPAWARTERLYFDPLGHQSNGLLATKATTIRAIQPEQNEAIAVKAFLDELDYRRWKDRTAVHEAAPNLKSTDGTESILIALQPDDWLSWEGALSTRERPLDLIERCCRQFKDFKIFVGLHPDDKHLSQSTIKELSLGYKHLTVLPDALGKGQGEALTAVADHVYTVSSAVGFTALLNRCSLISDANSYLKAFSASAADFTSGIRRRLGPMERVSLATFLHCRYGNRLDSMDGVEAFRAHCRRLPLGQSSNNLMLHTYTGVPE